MKLWNHNICLTSTTTIVFAIAILCSTIVLANVFYTSEEVKEISTADEHPEELWIPTEEDIAFQDTMYAIIQNTQNDITDIKEDIVFILDRLENEDGTYDSVRYVKGGKIDKERN
jgi:hypothetical protein